MGAGRVLNDLIGKGVRIAALPVGVAIAALLLGCARGTSGRCDYGVSRGHSDQAIHCKTRPDPNQALVAQAATAAPMTHALKFFERAHRHAAVSAVGINRWAETTFTIDTGASGSDRYQLVTYGPSGRTTRGNKGYVYDHFSHPFPVAAVHPKVLGHLVAAIRARQPDAQFLRAVISRDGFTGDLIWRVEVTREHTGSAIDYAAYPNGAGFCHDKDHNAKDDLVPAPGVPVCGANLGLINFTS
jgi:hypothetical protein